MFLPQEVILAKLLSVFQGTSAFHFRVLALLLSLASKLQVQGEQQGSVSVFKHEICIHFSYQALNSHVFLTTQRGCVSIVVLCRGLRLQSDLLSFLFNRDPSIVQLGSCLLL